MWDDILLYVIIGFVAQMIDGAIGMAYGVTASSRRCLSRRLT
jgi:uncharacterized membrane protein YfcA